MKLAALLALALVANKCIVSAIDSIPHDSTLVLGNIIDTSKISNLEDIADLQKKVDAAEDKYTASLRTKLSLDMDMSETMRLGVFEDTDDPTYKQMQEHVTAANTEVKTSLKGKATARVTYQAKLLELLSLEPQTTFGSEPASPIKWTNSKLEYLDLSSDTMDMNVQFFRNEENDQDSKSHTQKVASFVQTTVSSIFGGAVGASASRSAQSSMNSQKESHNIESTLVIAVTATHKKAQQFTEINWDADKLVAAWNAKMPAGEKISLYGEGIKTMYTEMMDQTDTKPEDQSLRILSGRTFGSSFIGFVHFVKQTKTRSYQNMQTTAVAAQMQSTRGNYFASITGKFGMDAQYSSDIKSLLSTTSLQSHVAVTTMGIIPSIASQSMDTAVKQFTKFSPDELEGKLNTLAKGNQGTARTGMDMNAGAADSIRAGQINGAQKGTIEAVLTGVSSTDATTNQVMDTNSLMLALDDYVKIARDMEGGVPVNFYVSSIDKKTVIKEWFKKYRPELVACATHGEASPLCRNTGVAADANANPTASASPVPA